MCRKGAPTTHVSQESQGVSGQYLAGQGFCFCCENGSTSLNARDKRVEIPGLRFQKEDGQGEENGAKPDTVTPLSARGGACGLCFFFFFPLSSADRICPFEIQPSDYLKDQLTLKFSSALSAYGSRREEKRQWELVKAAGRQGASSIRWLWEKQC